MTSNIKKSPLKDLQAASLAMEQEYKAVKRLKRLSIGNSLNFDPDLPPSNDDDDEEEDEKDTSNFDQFNDSNNIGNTSSPTGPFFDALLSLDNGSLNNIEKKIDKDDDDDYYLDYDEDNNVDFLDIDPDSSLTDSDIWVPANVHPKLAPENFRKHVEQQVLEIQNKSKLQRAGSVKSSLGKERKLSDFDENNNDKGNNNNDSISTNKRDSDSSNYADAVDGLGSHQSSPDKWDRKPSLRELTEQLENLSHIAGLDKGDAVSLARTLSTKSIGITKVEKQAFANTSIDQIRRKSRSSSRSRSKHQNTDGTQVRESLFVTDDSNGEDYDSIGDISSDHELPSKQHVHVYKDIQKIHNNVGSHNTSSQSNSLFKPTSKLPDIPNNSSRQNDQRSPSANSMKQRFPLSQQHPYDPRLQQQHHYSQTQQQQYYQQRQNQYYQQQYQHQQQYQYNRNHSPNGYQYPQQQQQQQQHRPVKNGHPSQYNRSQAPRQQHFQQRGHGYPNKQTPQQQQQQQQYHLKQHYQQEQVSRQHRSPQSNQQPHQVDASYGSRNQSQPLPKQRSRNHHQQQMIPKIETHRSQGTQLSSSPVSQKPSPDNGNINPSLRYQNNYVGQQSSKNERDISNLTEDLNKSSISDKSTNTFNDEQENDLKSTNLGLDQKAPLSINTTRPITPPVELDSPVKTNVEKMKEEKVKSKDRKTSFTSFFKFKSRSLSSSSSSSSPTTAPNGENSGSVISAIGSEATSKDSLLTDARKVSSKNNNKSSPTSTSSPGNNFKLLFTKNKSKQNDKEQEKSEEVSTPSIPNFGLKKKSSMESLLRGIKKVDPFIANDSEKKGEPENQEDQKKVVVPVSKDSDVCQNNHTQDYISAKTANHSKLHPSRDQPFQAYPLSPSATSFNSDNEDEEDKLKEKYDDDLGEEELSVDEEEEEEEDEDAYDDNSIREEPNSPPRKTDIELESVKSADSESETPSPSGASKNVVITNTTISSTADETVDENDDQPNKELSKQLLLETIRSQKITKPNQPLEMRDSAFGFPLPPVSISTVYMVDHRLPVHVERAIYRLSHLKLADAKRPLRQQVVLSNFMYAYLNLVNHTLWLQRQQEGEVEYEP